MKNKKGDLGGKRRVCTSRRIPAQWTGQGLSGVLEPEKKGGRMKKK